MRTARKPALVLVAALSAMAFAPSPAAAGPAYVTNVYDEQPCPELLRDGNTVTGGCPFNFSPTGLATLQAHVFGTEVTVAQCQVLALASVGADGFGYNNAFISQGQGGTSNCGGQNGVSVCNPGANPPTEHSEWGEEWDTYRWPFQFEETSGGQFSVMVGVCIPTGNEWFGECEGWVEMPLTVNLIGTYTATATDAPIQDSLCEVSGEWTLLQADPNIRIQLNHTQ